MRLLTYSNDGELVLRTFDRADPLAYAILSHTWSTDDNAEVTSENLEAGSQHYRTKPGYSKLAFCAQQARKDGLQYCWVDTCCINKSDFTELNEAINSMFRWYSEAARCYVYMSDVPNGPSVDQAPILPPDVEAALPAPVCQEKEDLLEFSDENGEDSRPIAKQRRNRFPVNGSLSIERRSRTGQVCIGGYVEYRDSPASSFECSPSYRPCHYIQSSMGPRIICYTQVASYRTPTSVRQIHDVFFAKQQNVWLRLRLDVTVTQISRFWKLVSDQSLDIRGRAGWLQLPTEVISAVARYTAPSETEIEDNAGLKLVLDEGDVSVSTDQIVIAETAKDILGSARLNRQQPGYDVLRHLNIRIVTDTDLVMVYLRPMLFVVHLEGRWVLGRMHTATDKSPQQLWHIFEELLSLRGVTHTPELAGVIVDHKNKTFKGYLVDLPANGTLFNQLALARKRGHRVPMARRLRWAKDIIHSVANTHQHNLCVGGLRTYSLSMCVEHGDRAITYTTAANSNYAGFHDFGGLLPPECRNEAFRAGLAPVTPAFDIFQLGLALWHLCRDHDRASARVRCSLADCENATKGNGRGICHDLHTNPIELPDPGDHVPGYLKRIIAACRRSDPKLRPTASHLLETIPGDFDKQDDGCKQKNNYTPTTTLARSCFVRIEDVLKAFRITYIFTICSDQCEDLEYHCNTCDRGNVDLCHKCFTQGWHCDNAAHWLHQIRLTNWPSEESTTRAIFFSSPAKLGRREAPFV